VAEQVKVDHKTVAARLKAILADAAMKQSAREVSAHFRATDGVPTACTLLEELVGKDAVPV
jgi:UDP:flavonoid glycosyltransferase YjiC (YdhE family)